MRAEGWAALVVAGGPDPGPVRYVSGNPDLTADCAAVMAKGRAPVLLAPTSAGLRGGPGWIAEVRAVTGPRGIGTAALKLLEEDADPAEAVVVTDRAGVANLTAEMIGISDRGGTGSSVGVASRTGMAALAAGAASTGGRVGVADLALAPAGVAEALGGRFELADAGPVIAACRAVKSPEELDAVREAAWVADRCFEHLLKTAEPGRTLRQVAAGLTRRALSLGACRLEATVAASAFDGGRIGGAIPADDGPLVPSRPLCLRLEVTGRLGYRAVLGRPVGFAPPDEAAERTARAAVTALDAAVRVLGPGVSGAAVYRTAAEAAASEGDALVGPLGGGIGLGGLEPPSAAEGSDDVIAAGNAIALTAHVIDEATGEEASASDTVIIGTDTGRRLSELPIGTLYVSHPPR